MRRRLWSTPVSHCPPRPGSPLLLYDVLQPRHHQLRGEGAEAEPRAAGLQGGDDLGEVVADEAKAGVFRKLLDHCKEEAGEAGPPLPPPTGAHPTPGWERVPAVVVGGPQRPSPRLRAF